MEEIDKKKNQKSKRKNLKMKWQVIKPKEIAYRMKIRKAMQQSSIEELHICLEECRKEINRRNARK